MGRLCLTLMLSLCPLLSHAQQGIITTVAGTGTPGFSGDGGAANRAQLGTGGTLGVAVDNAGNLLIVDGGNNRIRKVDAAGVITTVAGGGTPGGSGDGGPANRAQVFPNSVSSDDAGNLYITQGATIRKVNTAGIISTIAGNGGINSAGDGGPALSASFLATDGVADGAGNLYIADSLGHRIRKISTSGIITTIAGTGAQGFSGDGGPAIAARLALPQGVAVDRAGNVYFADGLNARIRKIDSAGIITTVAGNGSPIGIGDGGPATASGMTPVWVAVDGEGNLYIADTGSNRIRKVNTAGTISTFAGSNLPGFLGDDGPAGSARLFGPTGVAVDRAGNVYIADKNNYRVRKVSSGASVSPVQASPSSLSFSYTTGGDAPPGQTVVIISPGATLTFTAEASTAGGDNWLSVSPSSGPVSTVLTVSVAVGGLAPGTYSGTVTLVPSGAGNTPLVIPVRLTVNEPASQGVISTIAGNGLVPFNRTGEGGPARNAAMWPVGVAVDGAGNVYVADVSASRVFKVTPGGTLTTHAGNGATTFVGDGGPATSASLFSPNGVAADAVGSVYIVDTTNARVRKVDAAGVIDTVAGSARQGFAGDGGSAASASLFSPMGAAVDGAGNLYIADSGNSRIRKVSPSGTISTVAGSLLPGFGGDGGSATAAQLFLPGGVAVDGAGNLFIADINNNRIRKVTPAGIISTVAGNGTKGFSGDGGPATSAALNMFGAHIGIAADGSGNLYIADSANNRIRKVSAAGIISTVAGNGIAGFSGDGSPATTAGLNNPTDVAVDGAGNLYIADTTNRRIRKVTFAGGSGGAPAISSNGVVNGASFQPGIAANSWATIQGTNLATVTATWDRAIVDGRLPATLEGVSVTIAGKPAYLYYISPGQINLIVPDIPAGPAEVRVTAPGGSSTFTVTAAEYGPAFFSWPGGQPVATRQDYSFVAKGGTFSGASTTPARPGEVIILWGTGFGPTAPAAPVGVQIPPDRTYSTAAPPEVTVNGVAATVYGAALAPGFAGLYQVAIQVPATLVDGDWPIVATAGGVRSPAGTLTVRR